VHYLYVYTYTHIYTSTLSGFRAADCTTLHQTAPHCTTLHRTAPHCNALRHTAITAMHCATLQSLQRTVPHCNALRHTATHCDTLYHAATHHNTPQHTPTNCRCWECSGSCRAFLLHYSRTHTHTPTTKTKKYANSVEGRNRKRAGGKGVGVHGCWDGQMMHHMSLCICRLRPSLPLLHLYKHTHTHTHTPTPPQPPRHRLPSCPTMLRRMVSDDFIDPFVKLSSRSGRVLEYSTWTTRHLVLITLCNSRLRQTVIFIIISLCFSSFRSL